LGLSLDLCFGGDTSIPITTAGMHAHRERPREGQQGVHLQPSPVTKLAGTRTVESTFLFKSHSLWYFVMAARAD
jgi:hypothetical protein